MISDEHTYARSGPVRRAMCCIKHTGNRIFKPLSGSFRRDMSLTFKHDVPYSHSTNTVINRRASPRLLTEQDASVLFRVSPRSLRTARKQGRLTAVRIGRCVRYTIDDLQAFLDCCREFETPAHATHRHKSVVRNCTTKPRTFSSRRAGR